jgi:hypothetical protein
MDGMEELVKGKNDAPRLNAQMQLRETFLWTQGLSYHGQS